jgi:hypothetical protein
VKRKGFRGGGSIGFFDTICVVGDILIFVRPDGVFVPKQAVYDYVVV